MAKTKVSQQEAGAIRRFRSSADAAHIKNVLLRELHLSRDVYEDNVADEANRVTVNAVKLVLRVLFDDELERNDE
nr:MAG TPA: hypothetical protein [Caudoviricetes sp.]